MSGSTRGGVIVRIDGDLAFVPSEVALRVAPSPRIARVAGAPGALRGIALFEGAVIPVVAVGDRSGSMLVCVRGAERIGLVGLDVVASGLFPADLAEGSAGVTHAGRAIPPLSVEDVVAVVQGTRWVARA